MVLTIVPVILLQGLRYNVGTDYQSYLSLYNGFSNNNNLYLSWYESEPLFIYLCKALYSLTFGNQSALFMFDAIVMGIFSFLTFDYYKEKVDMPILYLFYYGTCLPYFFNVERQGVAVVLVWYSMHFAQEKKFIKFLLCIITATLFHNTAIIGIVFYVIWHIAERKSVYIKCVLFFIAILAPVIFSISVDFLSLYIPIFSKYTKFLTETGDQRVNINFVFFMIMLLIMIKLQKFIDKEDKFYIVLLSIMCCMTFLLNEYIAWGFRMSFYFEISLMIGYGHIYNKLNYQSNKRILCLFLVVVMMFYFTYKFWIQGNSEIFPYQSVLFK